MSSKQLKSILSGIPSATIEGQKTLAKEINEEVTSIDTNKWDAKLLARIPQKLKDELREYIKAHKGVNEQILVLKGLKSIGFSIPNEWLIDRRSNR